MSLNSALLAGTTGLISNSGALAAISDNIANVNTTAYKRTATDFVPLIKANSNSITYAAGGVSAITRQLVNQQGLLTTSNSPTDIGISGDGFFVVTTKSEDLTPSDGRLFTRAGSFTPDEDGYLVNNSGYFLQGWPVQTDGTVDANPTDVNSLVTINVGAIGGSAEKSTRVQFNANLDAGQPVQTAATAAAIAAGTGYDASVPARSMAGYSQTPASGVQPDFVRTVQVIDSKGGIRSIEYAFLKSETANQWFVEAYVPGTGQLVDAAGNVITDGAGAELSNVQIATGIVAFNPDGTFNDSLPAVGRFPTTLSVGASDTATATTAAVRWASGLGIEDQDISLDLGGPASTGGLTQLSSPSVLLSTTVNGSPFGDLSSIDIDQNGFVIAQFNNGVVKPVYQVPIATFINPNGLAPQNGGAFNTTAESGAFTMKEPGTGGAGLIAPKSLESSNVDLASEFTGLITTQRAYSAASKIITTADEMMEELIRMKR